MGEMGAAGLLRLLQLSSPSLPIGAYAYSHGLEYAVASGVVGDEASAHDWILGVAEHSVAPLVVPLLGRLYQGHAEGDLEALERWDAFACAARETAEIALEDAQMGRSLARLLVSLGIEAAADYFAADDVSHTSLFALACVHYRVPLGEAQHALLFSFCENQVVAAMKAIPLGQTSGQRILGAAIEGIPGWVSRSRRLADDEIGPSGPGLALASARHEQQYSRLFRS